MNKRVGEVSYNTKGEKMTIIAYRNSIDIDIQFEDGSITYNKQYRYFKNGKIAHPIKYEESIAHYIEAELGLNLDDIWNWKKNKVNPKEISKGSKQYIWVYCRFNDEHNYDINGNKVGYKTSCNNFTKGYKCCYCKGQHNVHWKDSLAYNYPNIAKMIAIEENDLTFEDCYNISCHSNRKFYFKCLECNTISSKKKTLDSVVSQGYSCEVCSDGISIPEKFMSNILRQLNVNYIYQLTSRDFNWCNSFEYDFYIPSLNMIIETHGAQHYKNKGKNGNWKSLEQQQSNDLFKYKCAKSHVDNYIVIDCRHSELKWLKENVAKELSNYFDLSDIDWELVWKESQKSLCIKSCELWDKGLTTFDISRELKISDACVRNYLKMGAKYKFCSYSVKEANKRAGDKRRIYKKGGHNDQ